MDLTSRKIHGKKYLSLWLESSVTSGATCGGCTGTISGRSCLNTSVQTEQVSQICQGVSCRHNVSFHNEKLLVFLRWYSPDKMFMACLGKLIVIENLTGLVISSSFSTKRKRKFWWETFFLVLSSHQPHERYLLAS